MKKRFFISPLAFVFVLGMLAMPFSTEARDLRTDLSGRILLAVEDKGEAWYVDPSNKEKYFLGRPLDAFNLMQQIGLGISNRDYDSFKGKAPQRLSGRILLRVEAQGQAYYVNPLDLKLYFMGRPYDAFQLMRKFGLGISNSDLATIPTFANGIIPSIEVDYQSTKYDNVTIREVNARADGWIVIYKMEDGASEDIVGQTAVHMGRNDRVRVRLTGVKTNQDLLAILHYDLGEKGVFEYIGPDVPVMLNNEMVMKKFFTTYVAIAEQNVQIIDSSFSPKKITVKRGTTITWTNYENSMHAIVSPGNFESVQLAKGKTYSRTFNVAGTFNYHCSLHPSMTGIVTVME
jgi:plastocyanin